MTILLIKMESRIRPFQERSGGGAAGRLLFELTLTGTPPKGYSKFLIPYLSECDGYWAPWRIGSIIVSHTWQFYRGYHLSVIASGRK